MGTVGAVRVIRVVVAVMGGRVVSDGVERRTRPQDEFGSPGGGGYWLTNREGGFF